MLNSKDVLVEYLVSLIGERNVEVESFSGVVFPLYLNCYEYKVISLYKTRFVFVRAKDNVNIRSYKLQKSKIESVFQCEAVLVMDGPKAVQRQNLIENGIMFVEIGRQLFMPKLGIVLDNAREKTHVYVDKFTPQMQLCALFFLYCDIGKYTVKQIAEKIKFNNMAIGRGVGALEALHLISSTSVGRTKYYELFVGKEEYLQKIIPYAISPVSVSMHTLRSKKPQNVFRSGHSALSDYSMLADNEYETVAISKEEYRRIENSMDLKYEDLIDEQDYIKLEVWKYDPALFAENGTVDKFSLCMSFKQGQDERTEAILKKIKESIING